MGKNIWVEDRDEERFQSSHIGCMWGVIHALNYHHWNCNNVKKMMFSQSHSRTRRGKGNGRHKKRTTINDGVVTENFVDEPGRFSVEGSITSAKICSTNRKSIRARIKALISDDISKEGSCRQEGGSLSTTKSQLRRTYSIHYLDPSVLGPHGEGSRKLQDECQKRSSMNLILSNESSRDGTNRHEHADVLDLFRVNQDLFQEHLKSTDDGTGDRQRSLQTSNKLARLTKSGSFPASLRPSKLKNKQEETWPFPREEKLLSGARAQNLSTKSGPIIVGRSSSSCNETDASACDLNKTMSKHRRTLSLNESTEKYAQLLEIGFSREGKLHQSKSLRLGKENEFSSVFHAPISFRRVCSLSHSDSILTLQNVSEVSDTTVEKISQIVENDTHMVSPSADEEMEDLQLDVDRSSDRSLESNSEEQVTVVDVGVKNLEQTAQNVVIETCSEEDIINHADYATSEDLEDGFIHIDANELLNDSQTCSPEDLEEFDNRNDRAEPYTDDTDGFNFVREILKKSGLEENGFLEPWHSLDQPLDPLVYDEVNASWPHEEPQCYEDKTHIHHHHYYHQLLFDLINEVLVQIYDSSVTYYPKALSPSCHLRTLPSGQHFVDEVCARISKIIGQRPEVDEWVTYGYPKDLGKDDGWMNLQLETECVGLELEDWIFEELLEEVLYS